MLEHHRAGSGEPLVLVHGVGHHWQGWRPVIGPLAETFEVIAVDSPGFGRSAPMASARSVDDWVDAFEAFFAELGLERPHVCGNSMGGGIALELARRRAVRSATAISPIGFWTPRERAYAQGILKVFHGTPAAARPAMRALARTPAGRESLFGIVFSRPRLLPADDAVHLLEDVWAAPSMRDALEAFTRYDFAGGDDLRGVPVTVAWGSKDRLLLYGRQSARARRALPWAEHVTLAGLGHTPAFDDPGMVAEVIRAGAHAGAPAPV